MLEAIEEQSQYMNKIVADLQDVVKPLKPKLQEVDICKVIDNALSLVKVPENVELKTFVKENTQKVRVDSELMIRALNNLFSNAIQAMPKGGRLTIKTHKQDGHVLISVSDTGVGISEEAKPKIFTPLFTTKSKGQGFGLVVCKRVVEAHSGEITFESEVGKGTTFTVKIAE